MNIKNSYTLRACLLKRVVIPLICYDCQIVLEKYKYHLILSLVLFLSKTAVFCKLSNSTPCCRGCILTHKRDTYDITDVLGEGIVVGNLHHKLV